VFGHSINVLRSCIVRHTKWTSTLSANSAAGPASARSATAAGSRQEIPTPLSVANVGAKARALNASEEASLRVCFAKYGIGSGRWTTTSSGLQWQESWPLFWDSCTFGNS
jgi:hypothetical protein